MVLLLSIMILTRPTNHCPLTTGPCLRGVSKLARIWWKPTYISQFKDRQTLLSSTTHNVFPLFELYCAYMLNQGARETQTPWLNNLIVFHCYLITVYKFYISLGNEIRMFIPNPSKDQYRDVQHTGGSMGVSSLLCRCISSRHDHAIDTFVMDFMLANLRWLGF